MRIAIRYSDHLIVMKNGSIAMKGKPRDVITEEAVKAIYGVDVVLKMTRISASTWCP
ncbi:hypothetical protein GCM10023310_00010 [Paenibacillus vulneris]